MIEKAIGGILKYLNENICDGAELERANIRYWDYQNNKLLEEYQDGSYVRIAPYDNRILSLDFQSLSFNDLITCPLIFSNCRFKGLLTLETQLMKKQIIFHNCEIEKLKITDKGGDSLSLEKEIKQYIEFKNCKINEIWDCYGLLFKEKVVFSNCLFMNNIYFNNSTFKESADFQSCEFNKRASFYGATFKQAPNFSQAIFKDNLNMVNSKLDFTFESLRESVKIASVDRQTNEVANDFRDSFRIFKNTLIKDNNMLDASQYHRAELYCKEIELDYLCDTTKGNEVSVNTNHKEKETSTFAMALDSLLLKIYRTTSDHHTNFIKILEFTLLMISVMGLLYLPFLIDGFDDMFYDFIQNQCFIIFI